MSASQTDGPRPPHAPPVPPPLRVDRLVPFVHVDDVERTIAFYYHLGFVVTSVYHYMGHPVWAALTSGGAELMISTDGDPVDPEKQGVLFYLYSDDLLAMREQLVAAGIDASEILDGSPGPDRELRLIDPDGYVVLVAHSDQG